MERVRYSCDSAVRGYYIYQDIWEANYGELLSCTRETGNVFDPFAVCEQKHGDIIGHVPRKISAICGLIFVGKEHTTKSTKIYTPRKFLRVRYSGLDMSKLKQMMSTGTL